MRASCGRYTVFSVNIPANYMLMSFGGFITGDNEQMFVTMGAETAVGFTDPVEVAEEQFLIWNDVMAPFYSDDFSLFTCRVQMGPNPTGPVGEFTLPGQGGGRSGSAMPPNCALLVQKRSALGGRSHRGRMFLAGALVNGDTDAAGVLGSGLLTDYQEAIDEWHTTSVASDTCGEWVILHTASSDPDVIVNLPVQGKIATQRRRLRP